MTDAVSRVVDMLMARGWRGSVLPADRLGDIRRAVDDLRAEGLLDEAFFADRLARFAYEPPTELARLRSIIAVAMPVPAVRTHFHLDGERAAVTVPPTYVEHEKAKQGVQDACAELLVREGYRVARAVLPEKTVATRSGLAEYGRNNICYVAGMGSYVELTAFYSDMPASDDPWEEARLMAACVSCSACVRACPTGAIGEERVLLHAEVCLTQLNERPGDFPDWVDPAWHDSWLGCMHCQRVCPADRDVRQRVVERGEFSEEETAAILDAVPVDRLPETAKTTLSDLGLLEDYELLPRNLSVLLRRPG